MSDVLLDPPAIDAALDRIAAAIVARSNVLGKSPVLVAIRRGGDPLATRLRDRIAESSGQRPQIGAVDITFYRDDAATQLPNPRIGPSHLPMSIDGAWVVLVDDVISTGRTIRAASTPFSTSGGRAASSSRCSSIAAVASYRFNRTTRASRPTWNGHAGWKSS